ncbi:MAG: hypothetical protein HC915_01815 [Anaerolineae bacterium]|nr:hypothetical protein [Anaerolineae bacterium]
MNIAPEDLLHRLGPYLPTDRFRALLAEQDLPEQAPGAALIVDISGFTPLTLRLVEQFGPQRASEELKRRLNPMFEAIAGQVFTHGGSVIRFVGDGFMAWFFDELPFVEASTDHLPAVVRATVAAVEMLELMAFFRDLDIKVAVGGGLAQRWVVGNPQLGLVDVLTGPAVDRVADVTSRYQRHEVRVDAASQALLEQTSDIHFIVLPDGDLQVTQVAPALQEQSRRYRWSPWRAQGNVQAVLERVKQFVTPLILEQEASGLGALGGELRYATPVFLRFQGIDYNGDGTARSQLDRYMDDVQRILQDTRVAGFA